ncbi:MAG: magnetosome biogenesis CDF transporter MamB [Mariprofundus sp.]|nr:magnetosome biogenesis CDF transporter MamB [Mariprofundus sp.]
MAIKKTNRKTERCRQCREEVIWWALFVNIGQTLFKGILGFLSGSAALVADAMHSGADVAASAVTMMSVKLSSRPPDEKYPYGYGNVQFISSAIVGLILLAGAAYLIFHAVSQIAGGVSTIPSGVAILGAVVSIVTNEIMFRYQNCVGQKNNSPAILANAWDNRSDAISSLAVLVGIIVAVMGFPIADSLAAIGVGILVGRIGIELNVDAIAGLMDASVEMELLSFAYTTTKRTEGVESIYYIRGRNVGEDVHLDISICVDGSLSLRQGEDIATLVRENILAHEELEHVVEVKIDIVPISASEKKSKNQWFEANVAT